MTVRSRSSAWAARHARVQEQREDSSYLPSPSTSRSGLLTLAPIATKHNSVHTTVQIPSEPFETASSLSSTVLADPSRGGSTSSCRGHWRCPITLVDICASRRCRNRWAPFGPVTPGLVTLTLLLPSLSCHNPPTSLPVPLALTCRVLTALDSMPSVLLASVPREPTSLGTSCTPSPGSSPPSPG